MSHHRCTLRCTSFIFFMEKPIVEDVQWIIVHLSTIMEPFTIAMYTGVSRRKVNQILATFQHTGSVEVHRNTRVYKHCTICDEDVSVWIFNFLITHLLTILFTVVCSEQDG